MTVRQFYKLVGEAVALLPPRWQSVYVRGPDGVLHPVKGVIMRGGFKQTGVVIEY